jgi:PAS domain S-box-containing protein
MTEKTRFSLDINRTWVTLFVVIAVAVLAGGYGYYRAEEGRISREKFRTIAAIAELKEGQIRQWRAERLSDVRRPAESPFFRREMQEWQRTGFSSGRRNEFRERLKLERSGGFDDALILSPDGKILLSATDNPDPVSPATMRAVEAALAGRKAVLSDFYLCPLGRVHIDAVAPVLDNEREPLAVLVQRSSAATYLYPLIQSWPIPSNSAESLLVQRQGDGVLYLNDPRHRPGTALALRFPLARADVPAVQAVMGKKGRFRGRDYRGVEVLADLRPVAGSPWFLVAKVDADEILAEARYRAVAIALITVCFILLAGMATAYAYRRRQAGIYLDLYRAEREQREAREEFRITLYSIGDAVITTDSGGKVRRMNPVAERLTGWNEAEAQGKPLDEVFSIINEGSRAAVESPVELVLRAGQVVGLANHTILIARDGTERPIDDSGAPIRDESGAITGVVLVFRDISERKSREASLAIFRQFAEASQDGFGMADLEGRLTYANPALCRMLGIGESAEAAGTHVSAYYREEDARELVSVIFPKVMETGHQTVELPLRSSGGTLTPTIQSIFTIRSSQGTPVCFANVITDISERIQAEEVLRESEERVRTKLNAILLPEGDIGTLVLADIIDVEAIKGLMEDFYSMENLVTAIVDIHGKVLVATGWQDICTKFHRIHPETRKNCLESDTLLSAGIEPGAFKLYKCKNNLWDLATPIIVGGRHLGNLFSGQFLLEDESTDYGVFCDQARRYGFNEEEYLAALDRVPRWSREKINRVMTFFARFALLISGMSYANIKLARMLAEREKMEAQLIQAQKMEAVGRLAGGVAHDFNNMLNVILGYAEMALLKLEPASPIQAYLREISKAGLRSADLTRQLLAFARKQTIAPKVLDLNDTVAGMLKMLMRLIGEDIDLLWKPAANLWPVNLDPAQIDQILANLVVNARDAIAGVGRITIETGTAEFEQAYSHRHEGIIPGRYVLLAVSDNGCGMDKETLARLFEPFFTTKEVGKGTGLGLATVYGIVKQNSGFINVYSEPGTGTTFRIYLPRHESEQAVAEERIPAVEAPTGTETVLLVEDEASLLDLGTLLLEDLGYTVLPAAGPNHALRLADEYAGEIDLLLTDVIMPDMSGSDLCKEIATRRPNLRCLYMSGYTAEAVAHHGVLHEGVHFLQKPFSVQDLAAKLREALDG